MEQRYLTDTSAVIKFLNNSFEPHVQQWMSIYLSTESNISIITQIELLSWAVPNKNDQAILNSFISTSNLIGVSQEIVEKCAAIRKNYRLKLPDALISATALVHNLTLVADNDKDFALISELTLINPKKLKLT
jgi:hypothetical protein